MSRGKWGESFLKSGLPLEHLTQVTFRSLGWDCQPQFEYSRPNREREEVWFELDLFATASKENRSTELSVLVECKYHDLSRYWFFLPHQATGRWQFDERVLNCGPYQTLRKPQQDTLLKITPLSSGGIVVSKDGTKQDNAVYAAVQQVVNGFVPCCLDHMFSYNLDFHNVLEPTDELRFTPDVTALVPMIVTNATLYRLKPEISDLDAIRNASSPTDIADEIPWTWYYYDVPIQLWNQNFNAIQSHTTKEAELIYRFPNVEAAIHQFADRPNWIAIVNIKALAAVATEILDHFLKLETRDAATFIRAPRRKESKRRR
jgi:hypothetical protein